MFIIHGNHDDPAGKGSYSALDVLWNAGLVNYFGKQVGTDCEFPYHDNYSILHHERDMLWIFIARRGECRDTTNLPEKGKRKDCAIWTWEHARR